MKEQTEEISYERSKMKNKIVWFIVFIVIALFSIWAVVAQCKNFSFSNFFMFLKKSSFLWIILAVLSMLIFIISEGCAISSICKSFGCKVKKGHGFFYSASDIYFSAITPSATGGQPASAYFMMKDEIPGVVATISLLLNLMMYSVTLTVIGIFTIIFCPKVFLNFDTLSKVLILFGSIVQLGLVFLFALLLYKEHFLKRILKGCLKLLGKIHLISNVNEKIEKVNNSMNEYQKYVKMLKGKKKIFLKTFLFNLIQRIAQIMVIVFVFLATGGKINQVINIWAIESFVIIGAYCIPIPGAIGVTDYLMLNGFKKLMSVEFATNLELLSRSLSFYSCILICGISVIIKYLLVKRREVK